MTDIIKADLSITLTITCPNCDEYFDLMDDGMGLNETGWLINQAAPSGNWSESHDVFELDVQCPECQEDIEIRGITW